MKGRCQWLEEEEKEFVESTAKLESLFIQSMADNFTQKRGDIVMALM